MNISRFLVPAAAWLAIVIVTLMIVNAIPGRVFSGVLAVIAVFAIHYLITVIHGPNASSLPPGNIRNQLVIAGAATLIAVAGGYLPGIGAALFLLVPLVTYTAMVFTKSQFRKWDVWTADVPFVDKDDEKMRPVIIFDTQRGPDGQTKFLALYVTSQDKDHDAGFRSVSAMDWNFGTAPQPRSWVDTRTIFALDRSAFNVDKGRIGHLAPDEIERIQAAFEQNRPQVFYRHR